ncbi:MAG: patatin-like phospholipase family protein [Alloprevotella sp.]|nr:patatin-like phospholipase family protein [Alloprevotella sp.]
MPSQESQLPKHRRVALVLSSGGARGYAHIGAIEALEAAGYEITSVAGASMGALVGGLYCTGQLDKFREWAENLTMAKILSLYDPSVSFSHIMKGERIINALASIIPDQRIEGLRIPFCAIATDLLHQQEVVIDRGSLYAAIRASIAIPTYYSPLRTKDMLLVDGGITNPLPLNRVRRTEGDLLVAVNVSAPADEGINEKRQRAISRHRNTLPLLLKKIMPHTDGKTLNYYSLITRTINTQIQRNTALSLRLTPPDVLVSIPMNRFDGADYDHAEKIIREGRTRMRAALKAFQG